MFKENVIPNVYVKEKTTLFDKTKKHTNISNHTGKRTL